MTKFLVLKYGDRRPPSLAMVLKEYTGEDDAGKYRQYICKVFAQDNLKETDQTIQHDDPAIVGVLTSKQVAALGAAALDIAAPGEDDSADAPLLNSEQIAELLENCRNLPQP
jgi:hypothetical protein